MMVRSSLDAALDAIAREAPALSARLAVALGSARIAIRTPTESFCVGVFRGRVDTSACLGGSAIHAFATPRALASILGGELDIEDAILGERVQLHGPFERLAAMDDALRLFVNAAVRAPSVADVMEAFLAKVAATESRDDG